MSKAVSDGDRAHRAPRTSAGERVRLDLPADARYLAVARSFAATLAVRAGMPDALVEDVKLAMSEVTTNAIKAHRTADSDERLRITARVGEGLISFTVSDHGRGFEEDLDPHDLPPGHFGLSVVRAMFGDIVIDHRPGRGTDVTFTVGAD